MFALSEILLQEHIHSCEKVLLTGSSGKGGLLKQALQVNTAALLVEDVIFNMLDYVILVFWFSHVYRLQLKPEVYICSLSKSN